MADFPVYDGFSFNPEGVISSATALLGLNTTAPAAAAWPSANLALFVPVRIPTPVTIYKMAVGGGTAGGNFDVGIYSAAGNRLVSSGATAKTSSAETVVDVTDTRIGPGLYYLAMSADGTNNYVVLTPSGTSPVPLQKCRFYGVMQMATAYTLPATATFAAIANAVVPWIAAYTRPY